MPDRKLFEYNLCDAWGRPLRNVTVSEGEKNMVIFSTYESPEPRVEWRDMHTTTISDEAICELKRIIKESKVQEIEEVEENKDLFILDGYIQDFYFADEISYTEVSVHNMQAYEFKPRKYPKVCTLKKLLQDMANVLVPEGVSSECFELSVE